MPAALSSELAEQLSVGDWEAIWTRVLERHVDQAGRIDFAGLKSDHADLDRVIAFIAARRSRFLIGAISLPRRSARLLYQRL